MGVCASIGRCGCGFRIRILGKICRRKGNACADRRRCDVESFCLAREVRARAPVFLSQPPRQLWPFGEREPKPETNK